VTMSHEGGDLELLYHYERGTGRRWKQKSTRNANEGGGKERPSQSFKGSGGRS